MIRNPEELTVAIRSAVNRRAIVLSHILVAFSISIHTVFWPTVQFYEIVLSIGLSIAILILLFFRFFDFASINKRPLFYIITYEILTFIGIAFLTEPATPYVLTAIITAMVANLYYGAKGIYATVVVFGFATITKYLILSNQIELTTEDYLDIGVAFFVFWAVCSFFANIQKVYDWDREKLKQSIGEYKIEQNRLNTLINSMSEAVIVLTKEGKINLFNTAALKLFKADNTINEKSIDDFAVLENMKGEHINFSSLLASGGSAETPVEHLIKLCYSDNDKAIISTRIMPLNTRIGQDEHKGFLAAMRDITREKTLEDERNEFISVISHELRTPLAITEGNISNALFINKNKLKNPEIEKILEKAEDQTMLLAQILNDLSTFAEAESSKLTFTKISFNPLALAEEVATSFHTKSKEKELSIKVTSSIGIPEEVLSSQNFIREILTNLVSNAIKYSEKGTINIRVSYTKNNEVIYEVEDQGLGIATTEQERVFNKFYRSEDFRTRASGGTGLGLYISQKFAKILGGEITVDSQLGKGSTFTARLPQLPKDEASPEKNKEKLT